MNSRNYTYLYGTLKQNIIMKYKRVLFHEYSNEAAVEADSLEEAIERFKTASYQSNPTKCVRKLILAEDSNGEWIVEKDESIETEE